MFCGSVVEVGHREVVGGGGAGRSLGRIGGGVGLRGPDHRSRRNPPEHRGQRHVWSGSRGAVQSFHQVGGINVQRGGKAKQVQKSDVAFAAFDRADVGAVETARLR